MKTSPMVFAMLGINALCLSAFADCLPIAGDRILGRDLALADTRFSAMPGSFIVGAAPVPGTRRVLGSAELARIARANGIQLTEPTEVCFEMPLRQVGNDEVSGAMRRSLPGVARLTIVEGLKSPLPAGELVFPLSGLAPGSVGQHNVQVWRGYIRYSETRKLEVWARVSISQQLTAVVAGRDLAASVPIDASALRMETWTGPLLPDSVAVRLEDVVGRVPKKLMKAGVPIPLSLLEEAPVVRRGDAVKVEVVCGPARLQLDAIAEKEGRNGEMVELRNPSSGKTFRARLDGPKAVLVIGMGQMP